MLYYIPEDPIKHLEDYEFFAPVLGRLLELKGHPQNKVVGILFSNLDFVCSHGDYASTKRIEMNEQDECFGSNGQVVHAIPSALCFE